MMRAVLFATATHASASRASPAFQKSICGVMLLVHGRQRIARRAQGASADNDRLS